MTPGPGSYRFTPLIGNEGSKFSIRNKTGNVLEFANTSLKSPGPCVYSPITGFSKDGKYFLSKIRNVRSPILTVS